MKTIFALLLFFGSYTLSAQSVGDELGTVDCNFDIHTGSIELDIRKKVLIRRAMAQSQKSEYENQSYGYGYAYTEWFLEFVSNTPIAYRNKNSEENVSHRGKYCVQLLNKDKDVLMTTYLGQGNLRMWEGQISSKPIYTYSLDLINLPLVILDDVTDINIIQIN